MRTALVMTILLIGGVPAAAQQPQAASKAEGAAVFDRECAACHRPNQDKVPTPEALRALTPEGIVNSLVNGKMAEVGKGLTPAERTAVAQFVTGRAIASTAAAGTGRCTAATPTADPARGPAWTGWGNDATNSRFAQGGLSAADLPKLKLKWAFGYEGATASRVQPAMAGGKLFVGSDNGELRALDPGTGCTYWSFKAESGIRSGLTVGPYKSGGKGGFAVFFGDSTANAYAVDSLTGQRIWIRKVEDHPAAAITGALTIHDGRVLVPVQGLNEEGSGGRGKTPCCMFRGSLSALNADTGAVIWKTYMVEESKLRGRNTRSGQDAYGPAGGSIWAAPTVDVKRRSVYVATGNGFADPPQPMTDAIVALDLDTGTVKWVHQTTAGDQWLGGCGRASGGNPGCPELQGPDHDFSASPLLATAGGRQLVIVPQKSGVAYALDPDKGTLVWQYRFGQGSGLGGQWGAAFDGQLVYFGVGDFQSKDPGGVRAVRAATGEQVWSAPPPQPRLCASQPRCNPSQGGAVTAIPGAVIAGSIDGGIRAYSAEDGKILWQFDTNREFDTVNGVKATGASIDGSPLIVVGGMIYVNSGYGGIAARPGNVLLAFGVE